jgi:hypothetical protein
MQTSPRTPEAPAHEAAKSLFDHRSAWWPRSAGRRGARRGVRTAPAAASACGLATRPRYALACASHFHSFESCGCWASLPCLLSPSRAAEAGWCSAETDAQGVEGVCTPRHLTRPCARARRAPLLRRARRSLQARAPCAGSRQQTCSTCIRRRHAWPKWAGRCAPHGRRPGISACVRPQRCACAAAKRVRAPLPETFLLQAEPLMPGLRF